MRRLIFILATLFFGPIVSFAQEKDIVYTDAASLPLYGKAIEETSGRYTRFPASYQEVSRKPLWNLSLNSAGLYIRFRSDAPEIHAKWVNGGVHMPHMADAGVGGIDLYALVGGEWKFVGAGFSWSKTTTFQRKIVSNMSPVMREYMMYLPLYDSIDSLQVGVPQGYVVEKPSANTPEDKAPIVMYGTSILQGGCASRPGMAHTAIIGRRLNREVVNLGFSGNAHLDPEVARLMAEVENPAVFVLDFVPNCTAERINAHGEEFFRILRQAHPDVPIVFVENPFFPHAVVDEKTASDIKANNAALKALYKKMKAEGQKRLYYITNEGMMGDDGEAFVDGVHPTDLGMYRYAMHVIPTIRKAIKSKR